MPIHSQDIIDFVLISLISLLTLSWCFLLFALLNPQKAIWLAGFFSHNHSMRKTLKPLETPISTERFFYRHHLWFGSLIVLLSLYILWQLSNEINIQALTELFKEPRQQVIASIILEAMQMVLWIGSLFAFFIGVIIAVRPSLLKKLEQKSNTWISTRKATLKLEKKHMELEKVFQQKTNKIVVPLLIVCTLLIIFLLYLATTLRLA